MFDRYTYICISCRFTSKYPGQCVLCQAELLAMYNLDTPKKRDDRGWKKIELMIRVRSSGIQLCTWPCCVPITRPRHKERLTLSQYKARIRKMRLHRQHRDVPQYIGM